MHNIEKFIIKFLSMLVILLCVSACAFTAGDSSISSYERDQVEKIIIKGKTSQEEILSEFGQPKQKSTNTKGSVWMYSYEETKDGVTNWIPFAPMVIGLDTTIKSKELIIHFNRNKIVSDYSFRSSESKL